MRLSPVIVMCAMLVACAPGTRQWGPADEAAIKGAIAAQESAWDHGDIDGFMAGYADSVCFVSPKGRTCGKAGVTSNYKRTYPDASAMGDLSFGALEILPAGADHAWCTGSWRIQRAADTLAGGFSLLWGRTPEGWRILRDHSY